MEVTKEQTENVVYDPFTGPNSSSISQGSSIFLIVQESGGIEFKSNSYCEAFDPDNDINSLEEIQSDPDLSLIISGMKYNKTEKLSLDLLFFFLKNTEVKDFTVSINRIKIRDENFYLLLFEENKVYKVFENKINTLQHALEKGHFPVIIADENYKAKYVTQNFEKILDRDIENLYGQSLTDILGNYITHEEEADLLVSLRTKTKWSALIKTTGDSIQPLFFDLHLTSVYDANLSQWSFILSAYNITDHVLKNKALKREEERLRTIVNNISDALIVLKKNGNDIRFEIGNDNFFDQFVKDESTFNQDKFTEELDDSLWLVVHQSIVMIEKQKLNSHSSRYKDRNTDKYFQVDITFVEDPLEQNRLYIITLRDTTAKEKYQKQLKKAFNKEKELNNLQTLILHNMSHELRTPANAMMGYTDIIEDAIDEKDYETVSDISHGIKDILYKLIALFNNIIELSSLESGSFELEEVNINCNQILRSVYNKEFPSAEKKNLKFALELFDKPLTLRTDWIKFEKMISELTKNAIKFTEVGEIKITSVLNEKNEAEIRIIDTGTGIEESKIKKVLQPFQQAEEFYTRSYEGNGLGLTIANHIASILGGNLEINSEKDIGTEIKITFETVDGAEDIESDTIKIG